MTDPGGCRKGRFITLADQHLDISKMAQAPELRVAEVFILRKAASKQVGRAEADLAVSCSRL
jgi:hypothetical protein